MRVSDSAVDQEMSMTGEDYVVFGESMVLGKTSASAEGDEDFGVGF